MAFCNQCGAKLDGNVRFCPECGAPVAQVPTAPEAPAAASVPAPEPAPATAPTSMPIAAPTPVPVDVDAQPTAVWSQLENASAPAQAPVPPVPQAAPVPAPQPEPATPAPAAWPGAAPEPAPETPANAVPSPAPKAAPQPITSAPNFTPAPAAAPQQPTAAAPQMPDFNYGAPSMPPAPQPQQGQGGGSVPPTFTPSAPVMAGGPSPLSRAWSDFQASPSKLFIIFKLALAQFLPGVGSLVLQAYTMTWAKEQALGAHRPMPKKLVRPGVLENGFWPYLASLIVAAVLMVAYCLFMLIFSLINLGWLFAILFLVCMIFVAPVVQIMCLRSAICGNVHSAFDLSEVWGMFTARGKMGKALSSVWVPGIVAGLIGGVLAIIFAVLFGAVFAGAMVGASSAYYDSAASAGVVFMALPMALIMGFAFFYLTIAASLVSTRAIGIWMQDFHPESWPEYQQHKQGSQGEIL